MGGPTPLCEHGGRRYVCIPCKGNGICFDETHNDKPRRKSRCKSCSGSSLCSHGVEKNNCLECKGASICSHGKRKIRCVQCKGSQICEHNCIKAQCKICDGTQICEHQRMKSRCIDCKGGHICPHNKQRSRCGECNGGSMCIHKKEKQTCKTCYPNMYLTKILRTRVYTSLKNYNKIGNKQHTMEYIGCSITELRTYLENLFSKDMTWENQGEWHIDHIKPCASFNLNDEDERNACFHYTNLQPMWGIENISKNDKYNIEDDNRSWDGIKWNINC